MKTTLRLCSLAFVVCAACAIAQFPPKGSQTVYSLTNFPSAFLTNTVGMHFLQPPWVGETKPVVLSGLFTTDTNLPEIEKMEKDLRFDLLFLQDSRLSPFSLIQISQFRSGYITNGLQFTVVQSMLHAYRPALPSNAAIQACSTEADLRKLLGDPPKGEVARFSATWRFFTCPDTNTIETLSVFIVAQHQNGQVDGLEIRRGIMNQSN
jgi:hypothetical protein